MSLRVLTKMTGLAGQPWYNTLHFAGGTQTEADDAADAAHDFWNAFQPSFANGLTVQVQPEVISYDPTTGDPVGLFATSTPAITSSGSGEPLPWATMGLVRWRTGDFVEGREVRGRTFIPALTEGHNTSGRPASALLTIMQTAIDALIADTPTFQVYSVAHRTTHAVVTGSPWSEWATLRSRRD